MNIIGTFQENDQKYKQVGLQGVGNFEEVKRLNIWSTKCNL